jgi:NAD(P)H-nitrite reductase large subunit
MLKLGEKGAILQRDNQTYAVAPHIPCGVLTPELLRKLADVAGKYGAKALKITGATRIAIVGLKEDPYFLAAVWSTATISLSACGWATS